MSDGAVRRRFDPRGLVAWPEAPLGTSVPDVPDVFLLAGPNTGPGHGGSVVAARRAALDDFDTGSVAR